MFPFIYNNTWIHDDKVLHFIFSFIISFWIYVYLKRKIQDKKKIISLIILLIFGLWIFKELLDSITPWRNVEIADILTNFIWMWFFLIILKIKNTIAKHLSKKA